MELLNNLENYKRVLITGAAGFIGINIVKEFINNKWEVFAFIHNNVPKELINVPQVNFIKGDIADKNFICNLNLDIDVVVHCAGIASDIGDDYTFKKVNFEPIKYLCTIPKQKFIYISSSDVYGIKDFNNADETAPLCEFPSNPYPRYKIMSENWLKENCPVPYVIIRPCAVWGENDKTLESRFVDFLKISPFIIHFGKWKGNNRWPLANVKNVAKTVIAVSEINNFNNEAINIIDNEKITIDEYYRKIALKYFPDKKYKTITLPLFIGKLIGLISTYISNLLHKKSPVFDPTFYALHHVSSNLDFSSKKMEQVFKIYESEKINRIK